jgi:hypothetical protein|tara:strand:+ start:50 stop:496 length:447 start_codon:yes stop_codon:yes gene_type:complete
MNKKENLDRPYMLHVAEVIYTKISKIKKDNPEISNIDAIDRFIGTEKYNEISSGKFHDIWFKELESNHFIDKKTGKKIPNETIKLLQVQRDMMIKQLIKTPNLYYTKSFYPLEISQRAFNHLWRICETYELWCKEVGKLKLINLKLLD